MIKAVSAGFTYEGSTTPALEDINITIENGSIFGIAGSAGAGKTTLAMCLNGGIPHCIDGDFTGDILLDGTPLSEIALEDLSFHIGSVFQDVESQIVSSIVEDEIVFGLENMGFARDDMEQRVVESLALAGIADLRHENIWNLSGGQKQRVAIAAALALRPRILVMDEPTSELDPKGSAALFAVLERLNREKSITIIIIEQKLELLVKHCTQVAVMDAGRIVLAGPGREILRKQAVLEQVGLSVPPAAVLFNRLHDLGLIDAAMPVCEEEAARVLANILEREAD